MMYFSWIWMILPGLLSIGLLVLLVILIVRLIAGPRQWRQYHPGGEFPPNGKPKSKALDILAERYAKGEISDDEYRHMKENLTR